MKKISDQFVPLPADLLDSPAFRVLNVREWRCLSRLLIEHAKHGGRDNGRLPVTRRDFRKAGVQSRDIMTSLKVLEALGLIACTQRGRGGNREYRKPNFWRVTFLRSVASNKTPSGQIKWIEPTHEWAQIETSERARGIAHELRVSRPRPPRLFPIPRGRQPSCPLQNPLRNPLQRKSNKTQKNGPLATALRQAISEAPQTIPAARNGGPKKIESGPPRGTQLRVPRGTQLTRFLGPPRATRTPPIYGPPRGVHYLENSRKDVAYGGAVAEAPSRQGTVLATPDTELGDVAEQHEAGAAFECKVQELALKCSKVMGYKISDAKVLARVRRLISKSFPPEQRDVAYYQVMGLALDAMEREREEADGSR